MLGRAPAGPDLLDPGAIPREERHDGQPPELVAVLGHHGRRLSDVPLCAAYSPDAKILATGGGPGDPVVTLWDAATMQRQKVLAGPKLAVNDEPFGADGLGVYHLAFSADGKALASCDLGGTLRLWDLAGARPRALAQFRVPKEGRRWRVAFAPDAPVLAAANGTAVVRLLDVSRSPPKEVGTLENPCGVYRVAYAGSGQALAALGLDNTLRLWDLSGPRPHVAWELRLGGSANGLAFSPDGKVLAVGSGTAFSVPGAQSITPGAVRLWRVGAGEPKAWATLPDRGAGRVEQVDQVALSGDGHTLVFACLTGRYHVYDLSGDRPRARYTFEDFAVTREHLGDAVPAFALSRDGCRLVTVGWPDQRVRVWDLSGARPCQVHPGRPVDPWLYAAVKFAPGGRGLAAWRHRTESDGSAKGEVVLWDLDGPAPARRAAFALNDVWLDNMSFSPEGQTLATCRHSEGWVVPLWDIVRAAPSCRARVKMPRGEGCGTLRFSPAGRVLTTAGSHTIYLWDVSGPEPKRVAAVDGEPSYVEDLSFSADGKMMAEGSGAGGFRVWRLDGAAPPLFAAVETGASAHAHVALSHDGKSLACAGFYFFAGKKASVFFYDLTGPQPKLRRRFDWERETGWIGGGPMARVSFTPDDRRLLLAVEDEVVVLDAASGKQLFRRQLPGRMVDADFAPDGRHIAVVNGDGTVYILRLPALADQPPAK